MMRWAAENCCTKMRLLLSFEDVPSCFNAKMHASRTHMHAQLRNEHPNYFYMLHKNGFIQDIQYSCEIRGGIYAIPLR